ncbi:MAG: hypothetical protein WCA20_38435 [Candidatus Sulfotelmatobacter sp.]
MHFSAEDRDGAGDESTGSHIAGHDEEDHVVASGGDYRDQRPADEALAGALRDRDSRRSQSEIYYAQLVEEESTLTVMTGLRELVERQGVFCALYSDRSSHFWLTPKVEGRVAPHRLTQMGRALRELGEQMIPAYSPSGRGRSERNFGTWQGRLPQELRLHGIATLEAAANAFLREQNIAEFNRRFRVRAAQPGTALCLTAAGIWI